jgi:calcineurin-like phosphoesterase family protein
MNRWFISDTHFSHENIIAYTGRPFQSVNEMNEKLIKNWNALVKPEDMIFFLGDFGLGSTDFLTDLCAGLNGNKICIRGNHDGTPSKMHTIGFSLVLESAFIKIGRHQVELIHIPSQPAPSHFQLHGHVHEKRPNKLVDRQLNLSVEVWDYKPVHEKTITAILDHADHHSQ